MIVKYAIKSADIITCDCETVKHKIVRLTGFNGDKICDLSLGDRTGALLP